jgi:hypothetical protein
MPAGFKTYDGNANEVFTSTDSTWTVLFTGLANANTSVNWTIPYMPTRVVTRQMLNQVTGDDEAYVHSYSWSGNTLQVTVPSSTDTVATFFVVYGK